MNRDETVALFLECEAKRGKARAAALAGGKSKGEAGGMAHEAAKAHWNAWAEARLAERKAMEADGRWSAEKHPWGTLEAKNDETRAWMESAAADFSRCLFLERGAEGSSKGAAPPVKTIQLKADRDYFERYIFPGCVSFKKAAFTGYTGFDHAIFSGYASFESAIFTDRASFENATFTGSASFDRATFCGNAWFDHATFSGYAWFKCATFTGPASFDRATFSGDAGFDDAIFSGYASFRSATFTGYARFESATFTGYARFDRATFTGPTRFESAAFKRHVRFASLTFSGDASFENATFSGYAWFKSAIFQNSTNYREAKFDKTASFTGIKVERAFDMTGAVFKQVPAFNQADFKQAPDLDDVKFPLPFFRGDAGLIARYRAIRRMAIQGADYEPEQMAFKAELRSRRWTTDKWWHWGTWFGLLYDLLADCGRSIVRPVLLWQASVVVFAVLYLRLADQPEGFSCGTPFVKALFLSGRNALVLFSGGRDARIAQAYRCLYGGDGEPQIPDGVSFLEAFVQVPVSAVLIFLLLLAIKNRFKIK